MTRRRPVAALALCLAVLVSCTSTPGTPASSTPTTSGPAPAASTSAGPTAGGSGTSTPGGTTTPGTTDTSTPSSTAAGSSTATDGFVPTVAFGRCDPTWNPAVDLTGFRCATTTVPLDWADSAGAKIELAVVMHPATDQSHKLGTLFFNPGGPGGTASGQFSLWYGYFPAELRKRFDIVSWDPRGIGFSTVVQCYDTPEKMGAATAGIDGYPRDRAAQRLYTTAMAAITAQCGTRAGKLLDHVSTTDTARDLEGLRRALGAKPLNYLGISYGTFLGATYANLFPANIRSMVLDGNLDPNNWFNSGRPATASLNTRIGSDRGVTENEQAFLTLCGRSTVAHCAFSAGSAAATAAKWQELLSDLAREPVTTKSGRVYDDQALSGSLGDGMDIVTPDTAAASQGWSGTATGLQSIWMLVQARKKSPTTVPATSAPPPASSAAPSGPAAPTVQRYSGPEGAWGVICSDAAVPAPSAWPALGDAALATYGQAAAAFVWGDLICASWPGRPTGTYRGPWNARTSATILLIGNTQDPSTPYRNTQSMARTLARTATLTINGYGHTMLLNPSSCGAGHEVAYFVNGTLPAAGTDCQQDHQPFAP